MWVCLLLLQLPITRLGTPRERGEQHRSVPTKTRGPGRSLGVLCASGRGYVLQLDCLSSSSGAQPLWACDLWRELRSMLSHALDCCWMPLCPLAVMSTSCDVPFLRLG